LTYEFDIDRIKVNHDAKICVRGHFGYSHTEAFGERQSLLNVYKTWKYLFGVY